ncbi:hypothetical protein Tco_0170095 [Tanacetum coccineum]
MPELTSHGGHGRDYESHGIDDEGYSIESDRLSLEEEEEAVTRSASSVSSVRDGLLLPISPSHSNVPSLISSPMISLTVPSPVATPAAVEAERFLIEGWELNFSMQGGIDRDHTGENRDLRFQLVEERRARLDLAEVVDGMRRGQEPRGGA